jgi:ferredoxin
MAVCPSDGFVDSGMEELRAYLWTSPEIVLHCPAARPLGYEVPCLGMLDRDAWTVLALWAEQKPVKILTGDCGACDDRQACTVAVTALQEVIALWPDQIQIQIEINAENGAALSAAEIEAAARCAPRPTATAGGLKGWRDAGRRQLQAVLPTVLAETSYAIPLTRQWLLDMLAAEPERKIAYRSLRIGPDCTDCLVCAKICPQGALTIVQQDGKIRHIYEGALCVQCGRCVEVCGPQTIKLENIKLNHKYLTGKILLKEGIPRYCKQCGIPIYHQKEPALCMVCATKDPALKGVLY